MLYKTSLYDEPIHKLPAHRQKSPNPGLKYGACTSWLDFLDSVHIAPQPNIPIEAKWRPTAIHRNIPWDVKMLSGSSPPLHAYVIGEPISHATGPASVRLARDTHR